jgi:predicted 3-demethylubiquinone-9 3-methyltransferase (glyoxalase superfamily)
MSITQKISPFLWFDDRAEEAAQLYVSVFRNGKILDVMRNGEKGPGKPGTALTVAFEIEGLRFVALNGGPHFKFTEAVSFLIDCESQQEVDDLWAKLTADGGSPSQCGWLKDKFGLSWQVVPRRLKELLSDPDPARAQRAMGAMMQMKKIDIAALESAADGR